MRGFESHLPPHFSKNNVMIVGVSPSGKATDSDSVSRRFESCYPSQKERGAEVPRPVYASYIWRHSQVVRQRSAKPLCPSSNLGVASKLCNSENSAISIVQAIEMHCFFVFVKPFLYTILVKNGVTNGGILGGVLLGYLKGALFGGFLRGCFRGTFEKVPSKGFLRSTVS